MPVLQQNVGYSECRKYFAWENADIVSGPDNIHVVEWTNNFAKRIPMFSWEFHFLGIVKNADTVVGSFILSANKENIFHEKYLYFVGTWQNSSSNKEIDLKVMPIVSPRISFCRNHENADIFVGSFILSAKDENIIHEKCRYFIRTWQNSLAYEEIIVLR